MKTSIKFSVAICTYNGRSFIQHQLESILKQTQKPDEIVICDDCSEDSTIEIAENLLRSQGDIKYRIQKNVIRLGVVKNFESALKLCSGDWVLLSDQDDIWVNNKIEQMFLYAKKYSGAHLFFTNAYLINSKGVLLDGDLWEKWKFTSYKRSAWKNSIHAFFDLLHSRNYVTGATVMLNKKLISVSLPFNLPAGIFHDGWLALNAAAAGKLHFIDEKLIYYRLHSGQQVGITPNGNKTYNASYTTSYNSFRRRLFAKYPLLHLKLYFKQHFSD
jgi:glycosyltransferase involved in cell wall biosynthesis